MMLDSKTLGIVVVGAVLAALVAMPIATITTAVSASQASEAARAAALAADAVPMASPGFLQDFEVTCGTSATDVRPAGSAVSIACSCAGAVSWGGASVTTGDYSKAEFSANVRFATCIAGSSTDCDCVAVTTQP